MLVLMMLLKSLRNLQNLLKANMKKDNKKALYESIMTSVAKEVKKVLNKDEEDIFYFVTIWTDPENLNIENAVCDFKGTLDECKNQVGLRLISSKSKGYECHEFDNNLGFYKISHGLGDKLYITMYKIMNGAQLKNFKYLHLRDMKIKNIR